MEKEKLVRGEKRIIGGVCSSIAKKYNFEPWLLRILLIIISIYYQYLIFIYLIVWLVIPNKVAVDYKKQSENMISSVVIGGVLGAFLFGGLTYFIAINSNEPANGGIAPLLVSLFGIPIGMVIGFSIIRMKIEKRAFKEQEDIDNH